MKPTYRIGPYLDLDKSPITLPDGTLLDEKRAEQWGEEIAQKHLRGRPSLHGESGSSPEVRFRLEPRVKDELDSYAARRGVTPSQVMREALRMYLDAHTS